MTLRLLVVIAGELGDADASMHVLPPLLTMYGRQLVSLDLSYCTISLPDWKALQTLKPHLQTLVLHALSCVNSKIMCFYVAKLLNLR